MRKPIINLSAVQTMEDVRRALSQLMSAMDSSRVEENNLEEDKLDIASFPGTFDTNFAAKSIHELSDVGPNQGYVDGLLAYDGVNWQHVADDRYQFGITVGNFDLGVGLVTVAPNLGSYLIDAAGGCAVYLPDCRLYDLRTVVRHNNVGDPGNWTTTIRRYTNAGAFNASVTQSVGMSTLGYGYNVTQTNPSLSFAAGVNLMDATFTGPSCDSILYRIHMLFELT